VARSFAQSLCQLSSMPDLSEIRFIMGKGHRSRLQSGIARLAQLGSGLAVAANVAAVPDDFHPAGPNVGVDTDAVTYLAAKRLPDRHSHVLGLDVPRSLLD